MPRGGWAGFTALSYRRLTRWCQVVQKSESGLGLAFCKVETDLNRCCAIVRLERLEHGAGARLAFDWQ